VSVLDSRERNENESWRKLSAVVLSLVLVASPVGAVTAGASATGTGTNGPTELSSAGNSSLDLRQQALDALAGDGSGREDGERGKQRGTSKRRGDLASALNDTLDGYVDESRTTEAPFETDRKAAAWASNRDSRAASLLTDADERLAATALADAKAAREAVDARGIEYDEAAVEDAIDGAERALERGRRVESDSPVGAINHYRKAWTSAQTALDVLDAAVEPRVEIVSRADPLHDDPVDYRVTVTVFDVRPYQLSNVTVRDGGETIATIPLDDAARPIATRNGSATVTFAGLRHNVTASVRDEGPALGDGDATVAATGRDRLLLDGDGLTPDYERSVSGTDPFDPDSDSALTAADEAGNGTLDGLEDLDGDGVPLTFEAQYGTSPESADTDGDGLEDDYENVYGQQGPLNGTTADTDGDGTPDGAEDFDDDGLSTDREEDLLTDPFAADTDRDALADGREVELGTDPREPDTDGDGLLDGREVELGTDPLSADSDGDGVADANETLTTTTEDPETGATVSVQATGYAPVSIKNQTLATDNTTVRASPLVRVRSPEAVEQATVTIPYEEGVDPSNLTVATWSPGSDERWHLVNSTVDEANGTVSAEVDGFSYFVVVREGIWRSYIFPVSAAGDGDGDPAVQSVDVMLTLDTSGSMFGSKLNQAQDASKTFVGSLVEGDRAGVTEFSFGAGVRQGLTEDFGAVNASVDSLSAGGGTDIAAGIDASATELRDAGDDDSQQVVVLLSDGQSAAGPAIAAAEQAKEDGITIYTVAVGGGADRQLLRRIANVTGGQSYFVRDAGNTTFALRQISNETGSLTDSDGDGLPDVYERAKTPILWGPNPFETVVTDPNSVQSDGDGLSDGEEMSVANVGGVLLPTEVTADPSETNSDGVKGDDAAELAGPNPSDPLRKEWLVTGASAASVVNGETNNPVTAGEADGVLTNGASEEDLVAVSSKSASGTAGFCIKELQDCQPDYLEGVDREAGQSYYKIPVQVYASSNVDLASAIQWQLQWGGDEVVKVGRSSGSISAEDGSVRTYVTVELCGGQSISNALACPAGSQQAALEGIGTLDVTFSNFESTRFDENGDTTSLSRDYAISRSFTLTAANDLLDRTKEVYGKGMTIASGATTVATLYASGASGARIAIALYETAAGLAGAPPTDAQGVVQAGIAAGISAFQTEIEVTRTENRREIFGDDYTNDPAGPQEMRAT
jgi:uncharacterized protein YegL